MAIVVGFESLTISSSAVKLASVPSNAKCFIGILETANVRLRSDGTNPTTTSGELIKADARIIVDYNELTRATFIRDDSTDATLQGHYFDVYAPQVMKDFNL